MHVSFPPGRCLAFSVALPHLKSRRGFFEVFEVVEVVSLNLKGKTLVDRYLQGAIDFLQPSENTLVC